METVWSSPRKRCTDFVLSPYLFSSKRLYSNMILHLDRFLRASRHWLTNEIETKWTLVIKRRSSPWSIRGSDSVHMQYVHSSRFTLKEYLKNNIGSPSSTRDSPVKEKGNKSWCAVCLVREAANNLCNTGLQVTSGGGGGSDIPGIFDLQFYFVSNYILFKYHQFFKFYFLSNYILFKYQQFFISWKRNPNFFVTQMKVCRKKNTCMSLFHYGYIIF